MASGFHDNYRNTILDGIFSYAAAGTRIINGSNVAIIAENPWIALLTANWLASLNVGTNEVTGGSYARVQHDFAAAAAGAVTNGSNIDFTGMPACTVKAVAVCATTTEATNDGIIGGDLTAQKTVNAGDTFRIATGDLDVTLT